MGNTLHTLSGVSKNPVGRVRGSPTIGWQRQERPVCSFPVAANAAQKGTTQAAASVIKQRSRDNYSRQKKAPGQQKDAPGGAVSGLTGN